MGKRLNKIRGKLHSDRLARLQARLHAKREDYKLELRRQTVHAVGVLVVIALLMFDESIALKLLAIFTGLILVANWYLSRREFRATYFHKLLHDIGLPSHQAESKQVETDAKGFEETVIWGVLKNLVRQRDKEPLLATFWSLFSALLAAAIFGLHYAILGLLVLSIGDAFSTIIGKKWGKIKIFWCKDRSYVGFVAFAVSTLIAAIIFLKYFPQFAIFSPPTLVAVMALSGALIETIPAVDDNSTIPFGVALILWLIVTFF